MFHRSLVSYTVGANVVCLRSAILQKTTTTQARIRSLPVFCFVLGYLASLIHTSLYINEFIFLFAETQRGMSWHLGGAGKGQGILKLGRLYSRGSVRLKRVGREASL